MKALVTGAAGFIGSHMVDSLLEKGWEVIGIDNLSTGRMEFLESATKHPKFQLVKRDLLDPETASSVLNASVDRVFHFAANADVRDGLNAPRRDLDQNTIVTWNVLEGMRRHGVRHIAFSSTGSVYGEAKVIPTPEDCPFPIQTSLYGASKVAAEALIAAYAEGYGMKATVFRFVSIMGERYTHGHVFDFVKRLRKDPSVLEVLGDGKQRKSYLYVGDCIAAIWKAIETPSESPMEVYNLGTDEYCKVDDSIAAITAALGVRPELRYSGGNRGWIGDNPFIFLDCRKIQSTGWRATKTIREAVEVTTRYLLENSWVLGERD